MKKESIVLTLTLALVCWLLLGEGAVLFAKEDYKKVDNKESCIVAQGVENNTLENKSLAAIGRAGNSDYVNGDGVRLRMQPSTSATVLGTMYKGELVWIDWSQSNSSWYKVTRQKTNQSGWVAKSYITKL